MPPRPARGDTKDGHPERTQVLLSLVEHFVSPCQAEPLVDGKVEADKTAVRTVADVDCKRPDRDMAGDASG